MPYREVTLADGAVFALILLKPNACRVLEFSPFELLVLLEFNLPLVKPFPVLRQCRAPDMTEIHIVYKCFRYKNHCLQLCSNKLIFRYSFKYIYLNST